MKQVDCDIIKDLLPSYIDKTASNSTNELVEEHLKNCEDCTSILENMNSVVDESKGANIQEEQIDYLKGFKKNKLKVIIETILIFIIIAIILFDLWCYITVYAKFFVDINNINITYVADENSSTLLYDVSNKDFVLLLEYEHLENNIIVVKVAGRYNFGNGSRTYIYVELDKNTEHVYFEDKKGNSKEIWDKNKGVLTEKGKSAML